MYYINKTCEHLRIALRANGYNKASVKRRHPVISGLRSEPKSVLLVGNSYGYYRLTNRFYPHSSLRNCQGVYIGRLHNKES